MHRTKANTPANHAGWSFSVYRTGARRVESRNENSGVRRDAQRDAPARILLAGDSRIMTLYLREAIEAEPQWEVCGEAGDGREALQMALRLEPDLIILDVSIPRANALDMARLLRRARPETPLLFLSADCSPEARQEAKQAGAAGYLAKRDAVKNLSEAIRALLDHQPYFPTPEIPRSRAAGQ
jgi:DNA-binding NarL/FixJ family response regulator